MRAQDIPAQCDPTCVRLSKTDRRDNQAFLSYDCKTAVVSGDTHLLRSVQTNLPAYQSTNYQQRTLLQFSDFSVCLVGAGAGAGQVCYVY